MGDFILQTSPDKIRGKPVKYRSGDCLIIKAGRKYFGAVMTGKFNKYYNFTFMEFLLTTKPTMEDFISGRLFGTRTGSWEDLGYAVDQKMIECDYVDNEKNIKKMGTLNLLPDLSSASYSYSDDINDMLDYYKSEIKIRIEKSIDAEKFPAIAFQSRHLIKTVEISNLVTG